MFLNQLIHDTFTKSSYEKFLLEVFNVDMGDVETVTYLIDSNYRSLVLDVFYYGYYTDENFNEIDLYLLEVNDFDNPRKVEALVYDLLSLNLRDHAIVAYFNRYSSKWFISYIFNSYVLEDYKLVTKKINIKQYLHTFGTKQYDTLLEDLFNTKVITTDILKELFETDLYESELIKDLHELYKIINAENVDGYIILMDALHNILKKETHKVPMIIKQKLSEYKVNLNSLEEDIISRNTLIEFYNLINNQKNVPTEQIEELCRASLIEYLDKNTKFYCEDIYNYVTAAYTQVGNIKKFILESRQLGGKTFTQINIPDRILFNIKLMDNILKDIKVLDISLNSCLMFIYMFKLLYQLRYVNKLLMGYTSIKEDALANDILNFNLYATTNNVQSVKLLQILLDLENIDLNSKNVLYSDPLNLYKEYNDIVNGYKNLDLNGLTKTEALNMIIQDYNKNHMHSKLNINIEKTYYNEHHFPLLVWQLDYSSVFEYKKGFDIVISNIEEIGKKKNKEYRNELKKFKIYDSEYPLEYYYFEKVFEITDEHSVISLIISNDYQKMNAYKLRKYLLKRTIKKIENNFIMLENKTPADDNKINNKLSQSKLNEKPWNIEDE